MIFQYGSEQVEISGRLPIVPLRDTIVYPYMVYPMIVGRQFSLEALQEAMVADKQILLLAQKRKEVEQPNKKDLYSHGTVARVLQVMKLATGTMKVLVEGICRAEVRRLTQNSRFFEAQVTVSPDFYSTPPVRLEALSRSVSKVFNEYVTLNRRIPDEVLGYTSSVDDIGKLADIIAAHLQVAIERRQSVLEAAEVGERLERLAHILASEIEVLKLESEIDSGVREALTQTQREFYLQHQLKIIKEELGQGEDSSEIAGYEERIAESVLSDEARKKAIEEVNRLTKMHSYSAEAAVIRAYLDWLLGLPWGTYTEDRSDFGELESILDSEHYGLDKAKRRISQQLAVLKLAGNAKGPILCLVGPPGVGKTSIGRSIAHALDRKFARMSLGGMRDEAEIRGHRRTYVGSLPGRIVQMLKKAKSANPVILLDEIDKIGSDFHGDPASALLEVLDPEQNSTFQDHYLECEFDLSRILFITTANTIAGVPLPLLDRMEIIELPGYLEFEKVGIAEGFLIPKQKMECGLVDRGVTISRAVLEAMIREYTREAGVRELERTIGSVFRQIAQKIARGSRKRAFTITKASLREFLGPPKYHGLETGAPMVGKAIGLAWTRSGGEILPAEVSVTPGSGKLILTGKLGEVLRESAQTAVTLLKSNAKVLKISQEAFKDSDIHMHFPEGAVPKDGPSAGATILVALCSALIKRVPPSELAFSGEITLSGEIIPVGGLNAKLIAAVRAGIKTVVLPAKNRPDVDDLPKELTSKLKIIYVKRSREVLRLAFPS